MPFALLHVENYSSPFDFVAWIPNNIGQIEKPPIVAFLHGSGERGDNRGMPVKGVEEVLDEYQVPAVFIFPQCQHEYRAFYGEMEDRVIHAINRAIQEYDGDSKRIYMIGYSMGGSSELWLAARHPGLFAGMVCIAPGITWIGAETPPKLPEEHKPRFHAMFVAEDRPATIAREIGDVPIWFLQGTYDEPCPIDETREVIDELRKLGRHPGVTEYEGMGHETLTMALREPGLFNWLFEQRR
jgi:predicted peptidase